MLVEVGEGLAAPPLTKMNRSQISCRISRWKPLVRVHAEEHQPSFAAQPAEEVEHEADVAVLGVELRLVEEVHERIVAPARSSRKSGNR